MPAVDDDKKPKKKSFRSREQEVEEVKPEVNSDIRKQIMDKVGRGFKKVDIHTIIADRNFRVNCWAVEGEGLSQQWRIDKSFWLSFDNGKLVA